MTLTEAANKQVVALREKDTQLLRVSVVGGGCSGLSYKLAFVDEPGKSDKVYDCDGVKVVVDLKSNIYLKNLTLDFSSGLNGTGFVFSNPAAKSGCGCGSSFSA